MKLKVHKGKLDPDRDWLSDSLTVNPSLSSADKKFEAKLLNFYKPERFKDFQEPCFRYSPSTY